MLFVGNPFLLILLIVLGSLSSMLILRKIENQNLYKIASLTSTLYIANPILIVAIAFVCIYAYIALANDNFSLYQSYEFVRDMFLDKLWMQGKLLPVYGTLFLTTAIVYIITIVYARMNKDLLVNLVNIETDIEDIEDDEDEEKMPSKSSTGSFSTYYLLVLFTLSIYAIVITMLPLWNIDKLQFTSTVSLMLSIIIGMIIVSKQIFFSPILIAVAVVACVVMQS